VGAHPCDPAAEGKSKPEGGQARVDSLGKWQGPFSSPFVPPIACSIGQEGKFCRTRPSSYCPRADVLLVDNHCSLFRGSLIHLSTTSGSGINLAVIELFGKIFKKA
jgi:hypothetical protein